MASSNMVRYSKELRAKAKAEGKRLMTIDYDGRAIKAGRVTFQFVEDEQNRKAFEIAMASIAEALAANFKNPKS